MSTITDRNGNEKWLFDRHVLETILALRQTFCELEQPYKDLMLVVLASILTDIGNTVKDGKCVRYKKDWKKNKYSRDGIISLFYDRLEIFRNDIGYIESHTWPVTNNEYCYLGNALKLLKEIPNNSVDAVITSPPYLNSFDYTDVYMPELWALGFVQNYEDVKLLRSKTIASHVQVKWKIDRSKLNENLKALISQLEQENSSLWNENLPEMIGRYFLDMKDIFIELKRVLLPNSTIGFVIGTSSYYGVPIPTDVLVANVAKELGFKFKELRVVRRLKMSSKQSNSIISDLPIMRESIIILES